MELTKNNVAIVNNVEYPIPEGVQPLSEDGLYLVDFAITEIAEEVQKDKLNFFNPRHLGQYQVNDKELFLGQGFDKKSMLELMNDITKNGLNYPLLCRWIQKDGKIKVQVTDGERRWRCLDRLIEKNEKVYDSRDGTYRNAREVYSKVICRVRPMSDEEAFQRAFAVSDTAVKWGDGALARYIKTLYQLGCSDEKVCELVNKGPQWVAETNRLNDLDDVSFNHLLAGNINRKVALDLVKITDVARRQSLLSDAWTKAVERHKEVQKKTEIAIEKAEAEEEIARAELVEAQLDEEPEEVIKEIQENIAEAEKKVNKHKAKAASARPVVKSRQLQDASNGAFKNALRAPKIMKQLEVIKGLIDNNTTKHDVASLRLLAVCYGAILDGKTDIMEILNSEI